jgi:hypothetical protein
MTSAMPAGTNGASSDSGGPTAWSRLRHIGRCERPHLAGALILLRVYEMGFSIGNRQSIGNKSTIINRQSQSAICNLQSPNLRRRVHADAQNRALRQGNVLAFSRDHRAASTDQHTEQRAFHAADDPADDGADR